MNIFKNNKVKIKKKPLEWKSLIYVAPVLFVLAFLDFYPIIDSIYISMTDFNIIHFFKYSYVGLKNYEFIFKSADLHIVILNTVVWAAGSVAVMVPIGFILANILNQTKLRGKYFYRTAFLFPWAFPAFITILIWSNMLSFKFGIVNDILATVGIKNIPWITSKHYAMISLILVNFWLSFPYYTYIFIAAMQSVPHELYDAAKMDGYGSLGTLTHVTAPLLSRQISFITIFGFIFTWNNFYVPFLLTSGGPGISTQILITYSYLQAFSYSDYSIGAAYAVISIVILLVFVVIANKYTKMMSILY